MQSELRRIKLAREQCDLTRLIKEMENSIAVAKEQINCLTVESLHLKYLQIKAGQVQPKPSSSQSPSKLPIADFSIKQELVSKQEIEEEEEEDSD